MKMATEQLQQPDNQRTDTNQHTSVLRNKGRIKKVTVESVKFYQQTINIPLFEVRFSLNNCTCVLPLYGFLFHFLFRLWYLRFNTILFALR